MRFQVIGPITEIEVIARGASIREQKRLRRVYGCRSWRKLKGLSQIELSDGTICEAEIHWYEAHGCGKKEIKIKRLFT